MFIFTLLCGASESFMKAFIFFFVRDRGGKGQPKNTVVINLVGFVFSKIKKSYLPFPYYLNPLSANVAKICTANQLNGFYMTATLALNGLSETVSRTQF